MCITMETIQIDSASIWYSKLIDYARSCSWRGTGAYFAELLEDNEFEENDRIIAVVDGGEIVGFAGLVRESCMDAPDLYPWIDFLFVDEGYRNKGVAKKIIEYIFSVAKSDGYEEIYLCTLSHTEMYEKFGFQTLYKGVSVDKIELLVMKATL